jgi:hypothetical protein
MSWKSIISILQDASEDTLINQVIITDRYTRIEDKDKNKYPLLHCDITNIPFSFGQNGTMIKQYNVNMILFFGESTDKSKGQLSIDELNDINSQLDDIISNYLRNLYEDSNQNIFEINDIITSEPIRNNGAPAFNLSVDVTIIGNEECVDCD